MATIVVGAGGEGFLQTLAKGTFRGKGIVNATETLTVPTGKKWVLLSYCLKGASGEEAYLTVLDSDGNDCFHDKLTTDSREAKFFNPPFVLGEGCQVKLHASSSTTSVRVAYVELDENDL